MYNRNPIIATETSIPMRAPASVDRGNTDPSPRLPTFSLLCSGTVRHARAAVTFSFEKLAFFSERVSC